MSDLKTPHDANWQGPWIGAAFLCEQVLKEDTGVLSAIRIVDTVTHQVHGPDIPDEMPAFDYNLKGVILLKSDMARGRFVLHLRMEDPSGVSSDLGKTSVQLSGGGHGVNVELNLQLRLTVPGLHWIEIWLDGKTLMTRIPLQVVYSTTQTVVPPR